MNNLAYLSFYLILTCFFFIQTAGAQEVGAPNIEFKPEVYVVQKIEDSIKIDGKLDEISWQNASYTNSFTDITGKPSLKPRYDTKALMLWDESYLYIAAELEEPHVWATLTDRDDIIFRDNNFEVFIDPDSDTHNYYELEINALGTWWDLMLTHPYRNGGKAIDAWDIRGLEIGIDIQGTLNNPDDIDEGWTLEIAIPWGVLEEASQNGRPEAGDQWRLNFSRVQWQRDVLEGDYVKKKDPETGEELREDNWSWSPQGIVNMHYPEMWGYIQFSEQVVRKSSDTFQWDSDEDHKWLLRKLYYKQIDIYDETGAYSDNPSDLNFDELYQNITGEHPESSSLKIIVLDESYLMRLSTESSENHFYIRSDSKVWSSNKQN
ncbi:MAG: carbohydrate-binding family 9-like protein [Balneolaceae bacterium]